MSCRDYMLMEWARVPMMPSTELFQRSWDNIVQRATELHGASEVAHACTEDENLRALADCWRRERDNGVDAAVAPASGGKRQDIGAGNDRMSDI